MPTITLLAVMSLGADSMLTLNYVPHPEDATGKTRYARGAKRVAAVWLTPKLTLRNEPADVFWVRAAFPGNRPPEGFEGRILSAYADRRGSRVELKVQSQVLDLAHPRKSFADVQSLAKRVEQNAPFHASVEFDNTLLGANIDTPEAVDQVFFETFFGDECLRTAILYIGDGEQLKGFLVYTLRQEGVRNREIVGIVYVAD